MRRSEINYAIEACQKHLDQTSSRNTDVEDFLTKFLLVHIYRVYESEIKRLVTERAMRSKDQYLVSYIASTIDRRLRLKVGDLKDDILGRFGSDQKDVFDEILDPDDVNYYTNIIVNRHSAAHDSGPVTITFDDISRTALRSGRVIDAFETALNSPTTLRGLVKLHNLFG
jgi:HEPN superfamily RiboL-PSP-like protein